MNLEVRLRLSHPQELWSSGDEICAEITIATPQTLHASVEAEICCVGRTMVAGQSKSLTLYHRKTLVDECRKVSKDTLNIISIQVDTPSHEQRAPGTLRLAGNYGICWVLRAHVNPILTPTIRPASAEYNFEFHPQEVIHGNINALTWTKRVVDTDHGLVKALLAVPSIGIPQGPSLAEIRVSLDVPSDLILHGLRLVLNATTVDCQAEHEKSQSRDFVLSDGLPNLRLEQGYNDLTSLVGETKIRHRLPETMHSELFSQHYILRAEMTLRPESQNWFFTRRKYSIQTELPVRVLSCVSYVSEEIGVSPALSILSIESPSTTPVTSVSGFA